MPTIDDYRNAIKSLYRTAPDGNFGLSVNPQPKDFKRVSLWLLDEDLDKKDRLILDRFYGIRESDNARLKIEGFANRHYRPIKSLLTEDVSSDDEHMLNLAALIVGLSPRPFRTFANASSGFTIVQQPKPGSEIDFEEQPNGWAEVTNERDEPLRQEKVFEEIIENPTPFKEEYQPELVPEKPFKLKDKNRNPETLNEENGKSKTRKTVFSEKLKWIAAAGIILLVTSIILMVPVLTKSDFMQWDTDHYIAVDGEVLESQEMPIYKMDEKEFGMRRVKVYDTTTFYVNDKPKYWYIRDNGYQFFDRPGKYPQDRTRDLHVVSTPIARDVREGKIRIDY
ncbi:hypothetical protein [Flavobacterium sp.]|uniref:hypothetical protein n=1 Tax=Flavobacterium sp. TaxID=239 RepID=UPI0012165542|nr:hypothetical protein [Flavobacterium sp.]RZJ69875.1 MAG: hypothetical protein EOO49_15700 [Flavobacterium sp.]